MSCTSFVVRIGEPSGERSWRQSSLACSSSSSETAAAASTAPALRAQVHEEPTHSGRPTSLRASRARVRRALERRAPRPLPPARTSRRLQPELLPESHSHAGTSCSQRIAPSERAKSAGASRLRQILIHTT